MKINPNSIFRYRGWDRKAFKKNKNYMGYVNDHHVIPKQHRNHEVIKITNYDINGNFNLMIMPTKEGIYKFNLHPDTMYHYNHPEYNKYVKYELDKMKHKYNTLDEIEYNLWLFVNYLKDNLVFNKENIPW
tara:strand:+ start:79 stop:471 length:393 start_codon:yes stop_codon:yes gene_type:complete